MKFSVDKCEAYWIGGAKTSRPKPVRCKWTRPTKNVLKFLELIGINFSYNKMSANKENYYDLAIDCCALLNIWKQRWLSLAGKIQAFKSLVASNLYMQHQWHPFQTVLYRKSNLYVKNLFAAWSKCF